MKEPPTLTYRHKDLVCWREGDELCKGSLIHLIQPSESAKNYLPHYLPPERFKGTEFGVEIRGLVEVLRNEENDEWYVYYTPEINALIHCNTYESANLLGAFDRVLKEKGYKNIEVLGDEKECYEWFYVNGTNQIVISMNKIYTYCEKNFLAFDLEFSQSIEMHVGYILGLLNTNSYVLEEQVNNKIAISTQRFTKLANKVTFTKHDLTNMEDILDQLKKIQDMRNGWHYQSWENGQQYINSNLVYHYVCFHLEKERERNENINYLHDLLNLLQLKLEL